MGLFGPTSTAPIPAGLNNEYNIRRSQDVLRQGRSVLQQARAKMNDNAWPIIDDGPMATPEDTQHALCSALNAVEAARARFGEKTAKYGAGTGVHGTVGVGLLVSGLLTIPIGVGPFLLGGAAIEGINTGRCTAKVANHRDKCADLDSLKHELEHAIEVLNTPTE